jgi:hypothetical protein
MDLGGRHSSNVDFMYLRHEKAGCPVLEHSKHLVESDDLEGQSLESEEG